MSRIALDKVGNFRISTIYTSQTFDGEPRYETAIFDESKPIDLMNGDEVIMRVFHVVDEFNYETREEALAHHQELVRELSRHEK